MRIAKVNGTVTLSRSHPSLVGGRLKLAQPLTLQQLRDGLDPDSEELVVYDELGTNAGDLIMLSEGAEAAQPFYPELKPIDAYNAGIVDSIQLE